MFKEFREFIARGNVVDLAVGVIIGAAFGKIVTSVVTDIVMPPIGLVLGKVNFTNLYIALGDEKGTTTLEEAKKAGVPTLNYGAFINTIIEFVIIAFCVFLIVKAINKLHKKPEAPKTKVDCPFCKESIPVGATKCGHCTSTIAPAAAP